MVSCFARRLSQDMHTWLEKYSILLDVHSILGHLYMCLHDFNTAGKQHHAKELLSFGAHQRVAALGLHTVADFSNLFSPQIEGRNMATSVHLCSP